MPNRSRPFRHGFCEESAHDPSRSHHSQDARTGVSAARRLTPGACATGIPPVPTGSLLLDGRDLFRSEPMDARMYFELTDAIAAATDRGELDVLRRRVDATEMHPMERRVLERVLSSRVDMLRLGEIVVPRPKPERAD